MDRRFLYVLLMLSVVSSTICFDKKNVIKAALIILKQCMKEHHNDHSHIAQICDKKLSVLFDNRRLCELTELMIEAEKINNPYLMNSIGAAIAEKLGCPINNEQLIVLHDQLSSLSYAFILNHIDFNQSSHEHHNQHHQHHRAGACTGTPLSVADYVNAYGVPIVYFGSIGILNFDSQNINSLDGLQDISIADVGFVIVSNNCIEGSDLDPNFPIDPFQGIPNAYYFIADNNLIESLPASFFQSATSMSEIYLGNNLLQTLPEGLFSNLDQLGLLELSYNMLTTVTTTDILNLTNLNLLFLDNNSLVDIPSDLIDGNPQLRYLFLNNNVLASWPATALNNVADSIYLDLSYNNLTDFEPESITDGTEIILTGNPLTSSQQDFLVASFPNVYFVF